MRIEQKVEICIMGVNETQLSVLEDNNRKSHERACLYIQEALLLLMEENDYEKIKITDIIKKSGVSRSAFYRNYFWKKDMDQIGRIHLDQMFPNASLLFNVRKDSQYVIWNKKYEQMSDDAGKGGYDLFDTFAVHFLDLIKELRDAQRISNETFEVIRKDLFGLLVKLYKNEKILPTKHTFILNNIKKSMRVYYGICGYYRMVLKAYLIAPVDICLAALSKCKSVFCQ